MRTDEGLKLDGGKARWDLLPIESVSPIVDVLTYGAKKYAPENWRKVPDARARYYAAALRHLTAWWQGEEVDPESGHRHLAHAGCCILFLLAMRFDVGARAVLPEPPSQRSDAPCPCGDPVDGKPPCTRLHPCSYAAGLPVWDARRGNWK